ncbi:MAG: polysaccharide biosynthesis C-terminal domain-containing protein, partial [Lachnospiraceae bacterium]|nr:polysaccharide biosynthesis C-terminal domain-containing protein [Lachnospiraceae bacterium]
DEISIYFLREKSCVICLKLMSPILPFSALRSCIHGYYMGMKKTMIPASGQLMEQLVRVTVIWLLANAQLSGISMPEPKTASLAVIGMATGEIVATLYTFAGYRLSLKKKPMASWYEVPSNRKLLSSMLHHAIPLTGNKLSLTIISSLESILIPAMLRFYYQDQTLSLEMYGVLTGMSLPFVFFPATLTNSLSMMLLPAISEAAALKNEKQIGQTTGKSIHFCLVIGILALFTFFLYGKELGSTIFHNESAGDFLFMLAFLCPFLYLSSTCTSILNGLGQTKDTFFYHLLSLLVRILFIVGAVPQIGIKGYLWGLLAAYLLLVFLEIRKILLLAAFPFHPEKSILIPVLLGVLSAVFAHMGEFYLGKILFDNRLFRLGFCCMILAVTYLSGLLLLHRRTKKTSE